VLSLLTLFAALLLDALLGEPQRGHPLVGFGRLAGLGERALYGSGQRPAWEMRLRGTLALLGLTLPPVLLTCWLATLPYGGWLELVGLYLCLGRRSLQQHLWAIARPLARGDLEQARRLTARIVSRDTEQLDETGLARAAVESTLENGHDALFATLFWFAVAGLPGALLHRLCNTLDAMWGYRTTQYLHFGWAAARSDDLLGWLPARLTALSYCLSGHWRKGWRCWRNQAERHDSPNAGPVMAAGAGALLLRLGGATRYQGQLRQRPRFGCGAEPCAGDIARALQLLDRSLLWWLTVLTLLALAPLALPDLGSVTAMGTGR